MRLSEAFLPAFPSSSFLLFRNLTSPSPEVPPSSASQTSQTNGYHRVPGHHVARCSTTVLQPQLSLRRHILCLRHWDQLCRVLHEAALHLPRLFGWYSEAGELRCQILRNFYGSAMSLRESMVHLRSHRPTFHGLLQVQPLFDRLP